mgnify:CR=1 FL=1
MKKQKLRRGRIIHEGLVPDTDPVYERGWTILTGRNLSQNLPRDKPINTTDNEEKKLGEAHAHFRTARLHRSAICRNFKIQ